jgi:hypothetical protein
MRFRFRRLVVEVKVRWAPDYPPPHFLGPLDRIVQGWDPRPAGDLFADVQDELRRVYAESPTETPFREMVADPAPYAVNQYPPGTDLGDIAATHTDDRCGVCGIGVTVPYHHRLAMCGHCYATLGALPPLTMVYTDSTHRVFHFGSGVARYQLPVSLVKLTELPRREIAPYLLSSHKHATGAGAPEPTGYHFARERGDNDHI